MKTINEIRLAELLPLSLQSDPEVIAICEAIQPEFDAINSEIGKILFIPNLEAQPSEVLEHLAWERNLDGEDGWLLADTLAKKVNLIRNAYTIQKYKGTPYAVKKALEIVGLAGTVSEWFEYGGQPYWFRIEIDGAQNFTPEQLQLLDLYVIKAKNTRSWAITVISIKHKSRFNVAAGAIESSTITFYAPPASGETIFLSGSFYGAASEYITEEIRIESQS